MVAPLVHDRERLGRVEVVVERGHEIVPGSARRGRVAEHLAKAVRTCSSPHRASRPSSRSAYANELRGRASESFPAPTRRAHREATRGCRATSTSFLRRVAASRCASTAARTRGPRRATGRSRSRGAGRRGRARRRGSRTPAPDASRPSPSTRCASRAAPAPGRLPRRVLALLVRLPEREVARALLERALLFLLGRVPDGVLVEPAREHAVVRVAVDPVVHVSAGRVRELAVDELLDQRDDLVDRLGRLRLVVGSPEAEVARVVDVPLGRLGGELGAAPGRGRVDLVVDVRDVLDQRDVIAFVLEPALRATSRR